MSYYEGLPPPPYQLELSSIPELVKLSLFPLRSVDPLTSDVLEYTGEYVEDKPTPEELKYYEKSNSIFQMIFVVINSIYINNEDGVSYLRPYAISLVPASKRGAVEETKAPFVSAMIESTFLENGAAYLGLDPFTGEWKFFSQVGLVASLGEKRGMTDELGLVYDHFFLRTQVRMSEIVQGVALDLSGTKLKRYLKHRAKLLYSPFSQVASRQIWGVENALELFVFTEIQRQGLPLPIPQALLFADGSWFPSLYHAWDEMSHGEDYDLISEVDFYYPDSKLAVFCDGGTHQRSKIKERDARIDSALNNLGIRSMRIISKSVLKDVTAAVRTIEQVVR